MRHLFVAPHADDEVLGCGGTIARLHHDGDFTSVLIVTHGDPSIYGDDFVLDMQRSACEAHGILGVDETVFLDHSSPRLDSVPRIELNRELYGAVSRLCPDVLWVPFGGDCHYEHSIVHECSLVAGRPIPGSTVSQVLCYEVPSETGWGDSTFSPDTHVDISDFIETKLEALRCYSSQVQDYPLARSESTVKALARFRGGVVGVPFVESFQTVRRVI